MSLIVIAVEDLARGCRDGGMICICSRSLAKMLLDELSLVVVDVVIHHFGTLLYPVVYLTFGTVADLGISHIFVKELHLASY